MTCWVCALKDLSSHWGLLPARSVHSSEGGEEYGETTRCTLDSRHLGRTRTATLLHRSRGTAPSNRRTTGLWTGRLRRRKVVFTRKVHTIVLRTILVAPAAFECCRALTFVNSFGQGPRLRSCDRGCAYVRCIERCGPLGVESLLLTGVSLR